MRPTFTASKMSMLNLHGTPISGAEDRQSKIPGFDQAIFSKSRVMCIGAGGLISQIAPTLVRKGIGSITLLDDDIVEVSNLNRQRFYIKDLGENKALAMSRNLVPECITATEIRGLPFRIEEAIARKFDLSCDVAICGVDNNPARVVASRAFRRIGVPVIFTAVSRDGDHGYVFVQEKDGPCIGCLFPDMPGDDWRPCPGTPAIADILQTIGGLVVYAVDTLVCKRKRAWNYRRFSLSDGTMDCASTLTSRAECLLHFRSTEQSLS